MIRRVRSKGFSIVELMISLALGSLVTVGVIQLFVANSESYNLLQGQSRMQESARFAFDFIGRSVRKAGYRGCFSNAAGLYTTLSAANLPYSLDLRAAVNGYNASGSSWSNSALTVLPKTIGTTDTNLFIVTAGNQEAGNGIDTDAMTQGSDILTVRNMASEDARLTANLPTSTEDVVVATPVGGVPFVVDDLVMIHDCEKATIFRVTALSTSGSPPTGTTTIVHDIADTDAFRNTVEKLALVNTYEDDAAVSTIESNIFYIAPGEGINNYGNNPLSLWRKSGIEAPVELVEGVEDLQLLFGVDTDEDETPNQYLQANFVTDWNEVKTIRVTLVVNSVDDVGSNTTPTHGCTIQGCITGETYDGLLRRAFTQTFHLRNRS